MNTNDTWVVVYNGSTYPTITVKTVSAVNIRDSELNSGMVPVGIPYYYDSREEAWVRVYEMRHVIGWKYQIKIDFNFSDRGYDPYRDRIRRAQ